MMSCDRSYYYYYNLFDLKCTYITGMAAHYELQLWQSIRDLQQ